MKRLFTIGLVWLGCTFAWVILGSTVSYRSGEMSSALTNEVHLLWGPPQRQAPPQAHFVETRHVTEKQLVRTPQGQPYETTTTREVPTQVPVPLVRSHIDATLALEHRRKGLVWFPTYAVQFEARYRFRNPSGKSEAVFFRFPLGGHATVYDGFEVEDANGEPVSTRVHRGGAEWSEELAAGEVREYRVRYRSRGTSQWHYLLASGTDQVKDFHLRLRTDFAQVNFPAGTLSPSRHRRTPTGWEGEWRFSTLVASRPVGVELPQLLNPGPLAARITFFAPVGLLFFFFVVAVLATAGGHAIHPLNYFFFGCAFFAIQLQFAYLVDHLEIVPAFVIASWVSIVLVVTYARLFVGWRFALGPMALSQLLYLVLFSFTFFWKGFTGLAITVGSILTLFVMMQFTGRIDWSRSSTPPASDPAR